MSGSRNLILKHNSKKYFENNTVSCHASAYPWMKYYVRECAWSSQHGAMLTESLQSHSKREWYVPRGETYRFSKCKHSVSWFFILLANGDGWCVSEPELMALKTPRQSEYEATYMTWWCVQWKRRRENSDFPRNYLSWTCALRAQVLRRSLFGTFSVEEALPYLPFDTAAPHYVPTCVVFWRPTSPVILQVQIQGSMDKLSTMVGADHLRLRLRRWISQQRYIGRSRPNPFPVASSREVAPFGERG